MKLAALGRFRRDLLFIPHVGRPTSWVVALLLPPVELLTATGLFFGFQIAKVVAIVLLAGFCGVALLVMRRRLRVPCNCFGGGGHISMSLVVRNVILITLLIPGFGIGEAASASSISVAVAVIATISAV